MLSARRHGGLEAPRPHSMEPHFFRSPGPAGKERNRPSAYSGDGDIVQSDERALVSQALADSVSGGIAPEVMAQRVFDGIVNERFYLMSEEAWRYAAHTRLDDIRAGRNPTFAPPVDM